ncbi:MAG TPA: oxidoreductase [Conexibacter sp.]|jgi:NAD(P)-dependent dehydrogenase (short-subunit alcohol dehydrogenase family)
MASSPTTEPLVWLITGAARGFGYELAKQALERGDRVVATARDRARAEQALGTHERLLAIDLDVTKEGAADAAVAAALDRFGRIDVLVNNAGNGLLGAIEEVSDREARDVFDTNVFGLLAVTRAVLPTMRRQRSGRVLHMSSVGGVDARAAFGVYSATKFAVEAIGVAMRYELAPLGIDVTIVEPGTFSTDFLDASSLARAAARIDDYAASSGVAHTWADETNHAQPGDPVKAATAMIEAVAAAEPPLHLALGADAVARIEGHLDATRAELDRWRPLSLSTDHDRPSA